MASEIGVQTIQHTNGTDAMTIDSTGRVQLPAIPCCHVKLSTSNSQDTSNPYTTTNTNIKFDVVSLNQGSCYSSSTGAFTCPVAGVYAAEVQFLSDAGTNTNHQIKIRHNSSDVHLGYNGVNTQHVELHAHALIDCAANDTISVHLGSGSIYIDGSGNYSSFTVRLVG